MAARPIGPAPPLSLRGVLGSLHVPTPRDLVYSVKACLAALVALAVGFSQDLENPYWSALTIYVVVNPPGAGAIRSKAVFRLVGTVLGGLIVLGLTGMFGDQSGILITATIAAIAGAIYLQHIDRTPTNYLWFAVAITISVIELNNITKPAGIFDITTARVGEIALGLFVIAVVDGLWPEPMTPKFLETMADWRGKVRDWLADALPAGATHRHDDEHRRAARDRLREIIKGVAAIDGKAVQLPFDIVPNAPRLRHLDLLRRQVVATIGDLIAIELRVRALRRAKASSADLQRLLEAVSAWACDGPNLPGAMDDGHVARGEALAEELEAARDRLDPPWGREALIERGLLARLATFARDWCDLSLALRSIRTGRPLPARLDRIARNAKPVRSIDYLGGALDLIPMVVAMAAAVALWYLTAWDSGPTALLFAWAGCVFLLGQGQIPQSMAGMLACVLVAFALVFAYQFAVLPRVTDFPVLAIVLAAAMIPLGLLMAMSMAGMLTLALALSFLALQNAYRADFAQTAQTLSGCLVGILIAVVALRLFDYDRARFAVRRLANAVRRDVLDLARSRRIPRDDRFLFLALHRLSLYFTAAEQVARSGPVPHLGLVRDMSIGASLLALRRHERHLPPPAGAILTELRGAAADMIRGESAGRSGGRGLRARVDAAMADAAIRDDPASDDLLDALIGLELALGAAPMPAAEEKDR